MKIRTILIVLASLMLVGAFYGYHLYSKKVPSLETAKADFQLTADELFDAFENDENAATEKYNDNVVEVTGKVLSVKSEGKQNNIILQAENALGGGVNCSINSPVSGIKKGQEVSIKGRCQGFLMDVIINNCNVVK